MPTGVQSVRLVFYDSRADVLLLDITATIPDKFTPYPPGVDASEDAVPDRAVGIHHPNGNGQAHLICPTAGEHNRLLGIALAPPVQQHVAESALEDGMH